MPTEVKISSCQRFVTFLVIICRVDIRHKIWQKQQSFALLLKTNTENIHIPPNEDWKFLGEEHLYEMYEVKFLGVEHLYEMYEVKLVSQSLSQLGQSVKRVSMHLIHVTNMVNEKEL